MVTKIITKPLLGLWIEQVNLVGIERKPDFLPHLWQPSRLELGENTFLANASVHNDLVP